MVGYRFDARGAVHAHVNGRGVEDVVLRHCATDQVGLEAAGHLRWYRTSRHGKRHHIDGPDGSTTALEHDRFPAAEHEDEPGSLNAPMPGKVLEVRVAEGDEVSDGDPMVILEAMKMEHTLRAPFHGVVRSVRADAGEQVEADQVLVVVEAAD